ncbi:MAG: hypothetical protein JWO53_1128 [Chlamydiia bacterium]|nr:hypothetical protein [Chlamydiia bacterium]
MLCVEVGGTRIKAAVLPQEPTLEQLREVVVLSSLTDGWLSKKVPLLFSAGSTDSPLLQIQIPYSKVSLSIAGTIVENRIFWDSRSKGVPQQLKLACEEESQCTATLDNDAVSWAKGSLEYQRVTSQEFPFPSLAITLGTGVGVALIQDKDSIYNIEMSYTDCPFSRLKELTKNQPLPLSNRWSTHGALGNRFFQWVFKEKAFTDEEMLPYLTEYNERFQACVQDLREHLDKMFSITIASFTIGGGNSRFLTIPSSFPLPVLLLAPQILKAAKLSGDIIQLLGCLRPLSTKVYPSVEEMKKQIAGPSNSS